MQSVLDAASHIAQEIEKTRKHLENLEQALAGLRPLITVEVASNVLTYSAPNDVQTVVDVSINKPARKKKTAAKSKVTPKAIKAPAGKSVIPNTGSELWLKCLGRKKLSLNDLTGVALQKLALGDESRVTIRNRAGAWLNSAVKSNQVSVTQNKAGLNVYQVISA
jgi:hypothetical protein